MIEKKKKKRKKLAQTLKWHGLEIECIEFEHAYSNESESSMQNRTGWTSYSFTGIR